VESRIIQELDSGTKMKVHWYGQNRNASSISGSRQQRFSAETEDFEVLPSGNLIFKHINNDKTYIISQGRYYLKEADK